MALNVIPTKDRRLADDPARGGTCFWLLLLISPYKADSSTSLDHSQANDQLHSE
jgi:hypothetical protein